MLQKVLALVLRQVLGRLESKIEKRVARLSGCVLFHLRHHGWDEVEGLLHFGEVFKDAHHAVVVLEGVHTRPGKLVFA
jgi:hypothetical protein